ncbi:MAG: DUF4124 domain-containing protein [Burkholderiales bacterium]|nr:DUF4124 domain-containing protein [Burkholderiales bacterium]
MMIFLLCMLMAGTASASVYKCTGADGKIEFSDKPCEGKNSEPMDLQYNTFSGAEGKPDSAKAKTSKKKKTAETTDQKSSSDSKSPKKKTSSSAKTTTPTKRTGKTSERRFIREGMTTAEVRARIGDFDSREDGACRERTMVTSKKQLKTVRDLCEKCWIYDPAEGDPQTRTHVCFQNGKVSSVARKVVR